ncbi:MAG TPA: ion transporter [Solirubrobacterales bacterium]|nr:ion transporter [Solirubrobacterales bacterium]
MDRPRPKTVCDPPPLPPRRQRTEGDFDRWVAAATERADPFMAWLGVVFALVVGYDVAVDLRPGASRALEVTAWAIWAVFAFEFAAKLWLAPRRLHYVRRHWWQPLLLALPFLRVLSFLRLVRAGRALPASRVLSSSYRVAGTARYLFRSRLAYLGAISTVSAIAIAELAYVFERDVEGSVFGSFGDALLWAGATVIGLQGDPVPESVGGQVAMIVGFVIGLIVVASLAGVIGSFLIEERRERASSPEPDGVAAD